MTIIDPEPFDVFPPHHPFQYQFADEAFASKCELVGLASFAVERRKKEVAIRKVLGATISGLMLLVNRDILRLTIIANLSMIPIVLDLGQIWLNGFAVRTEVGVTPFILSAIFIFVFTAITVAMAVYRTVSANSVHSLCRK